MSFSALDAKCMARALQLAERGRYSTHPNPRVGCVVLDAGGQLAGEGWHERPGEGHAEVNALAMAGERARGGVAYVTLEPCAHFGKTPPCAEALVAAGVSRVVAAMRDPNPLVAGKGFAILNQAGIATEWGLMEAQARALNPGFIKRMETGLPFIRLKLAMSLDGCTAMASGESVWITGDTARQDVQRLRAQADAIITGVGTVLADDPGLNVRYQVAEPYSQPAGQAVRIILDRQLSTPTQSKTLDLEGDVWIFHDVNVAEEKQQALRDVGAELIPQPPENLQQVLASLAERGINECHLECGAVLAGAFVEAGLVDELVCYMAPCLMGSSARPLVQLDIAEMANKKMLTLIDAMPIGNDMRLTYQFKHSS